MTIVRLEPVLRDNIMSCNKFSSTTPIIEVNGVFVFTVDSDGETVCNGPFNSREEAVSWFSGWWNATNGQRLPKNSIKFVNAIFCNIDIKEINDIDVEQE